MHRYGTATNLFRSIFCDWKSNVSRMNESTFLAKCFAKDRRFKTVPPKCGCNKFGSCIFLNSRIMKRIHTTYSQTIDWVLELS